MNEAISAVPASASMKMSSIANKLKGAGKSICSLALGDTHFSPPSEIVGQIQAAIADGKTHYGDSAGLDLLRSKIASANYAERKWNQENILIVPGLKQGIRYVVEVIEPDRVCILEPAWLGYEATARIGGAKVCRVDMQNDDWLDELATQEFDLLFACSPNNPDGRILSKSQIDRLVEISSRQDAWLFFDEIYSRYDYTGNWVSISRMTDYEKLIVGNGFSKAYAMTGFRLGWLATGNRMFWEQSVKLQQHVATCPNIPVQHGIANAFDQSKFIERIKEYYAANRQFVAEELPALRAFCPEAGFYYFFPVSLVSGYNNGQNYAEALLQESGLALVPGGAYGSSYEGWVRMSFSVDREVLEDGLKRLKSFG